MGDLIPTLLSFHTVFELLPKTNKKFARDGWKEGVYLQWVERPDNKTFTCIHIFEGGKHFPWSPSFDDMVSTDWKEFIDGTSQESTEGKSL